MHAVERTGWYSSGFGSLLLLACGLHWAGMQFTGFSIRGLV